MGQRRRSQTMLLPGSRCLRSVGAGPARGPAPVRGQVTAGADVQAYVLCICILQLALIYLRPAGDRPLPPRPAGRRRARRGGVLCRPIFHADFGGYDQSPGTAAISGRSRELVGTFGGRMTLKARGGGPMSLPALRERRFRYVLLETNDCLKDMVIADGYIEKRCADSAGKATSTPGSPNELPRRSCATWRPASKPVSITRSTSANVRSMRRKYLEPVPAIPRARSRSCPAQPAAVPGPR